MTSKELDNRLYSVECSLETVDNDISILIEQLNYEKRETARAYEELKSDRLVAQCLKSTVFDLDTTIGTLRNYLSTFRDHRRETEDNVELCRRIAKGGLENNESKWVSC